MKFILPILFFTFSAWSGPENFSDLSSLKEVLTAQNFSPEQLNPMKIGYVKNSRQAINKHLGSFKRIISWLFLLDAHPNHPLVTPYLTKYRQNKSCQKRLLLEILQDEFQRFEQPHHKSFFINALLNEKSPYFNLPRLRYWNNDFLAGTMTYSTPYYQDQARSFSPEMEENFQFLISILSSAQRIHQALGQGQVSNESAELIRKIEEVKQNCPTTFSSSRAFHWVDFDTLQFLLASKQSVEEMEHQLKGLIDSARFPRLPTHSALAFSYHPLLGMLVPGNVRLQKNFVHAYLNLVPKLAFNDDDQMKPENCQALLNALTLSSMVGLVINRENQESYQATQEQFEEWMKLQSAFSVAEEFWGPKLSNECVAGSRFVENIWFSYRVSSTDSSYAGNFLGFKFSSENSSKRNYRVSMDDYPYFSVELRQFLVERKSFTYKEAYVEAPVINPGWYRFGF